MKWLKHGVVWRPNDTQSWARSHASSPTPLWLDDGTLRVYVQCRDAHNVGRVGFVDLDPSDPRKIVRVSTQPVLDIGAPGTFDDSGVFQTSVLHAPDGRLLMYYVGFELCQKIRYRLLTGLAISEDRGLSFQRVSTTPILERSHDEAYFRCGPWVIYDGNSRCFRMWYVAGSGWELVEGKSVPAYDMRYIESHDGIHWPSTGQLVMPVDHAKEHGLGRPVVRQCADGYQMFYSTRRLNPPGYRMGFATSADGLNWERCDEQMGLDVSDSGWDAESVEFGVDIQTGGKTWLLYNGNDFGGTGFGIAERVD